MARPTKAVNTRIGNMTKAEREQRLEGEQKLKGKNDKILPPKYLTKEQKTIFRYIVKELEQSGILGNLDVYILTTCSIAIDRLETIETMITANKEMLGNATFMSSKDKYTKDLYRCCNELSLSPQSRAKIAGANIKSQEEDPLLKALQDDE
ncbi:MAG: phage terminase small subunit P27 family [Oscillospiraceae bacterium]